MLCVNNLGVGTCAAVLEIPIVVKANMTVTAKIMHDLFIFSSPLTVDPYKG